MGLKSSKMFQKWFTLLLAVLVLIYKVMEITTFQIQASPIACGDDFFQCRDGNCIFNFLQCNVYYDCVDESDEDNCRNFTCTSLDIKCKSGHCFRNSSRCNGYIDCRDKSDELNCNDGSECSSTAFACKSGGCIPKNWVCDSVPDCADGSDEVNDDCRSRLSNSSSIPDTLESYATKHEIHSQLAYVDDLIAFYHDGSVNMSTIWPLSLLRNAWAYARETYDHIHLDSRLYVIVERTPFQLYEGCSKFSTEESDWENRNAILCLTHSTSIWDEQIPQVLKSFLVAVGQFINPFKRLYFSNGFPAKCLPELHDLVFYDMYIYLKGYDSPQFLEWKANKLKKYDGNTGIYCFRDWYLPIYEAYGGTEVLTNFCRLVSPYLKLKSLSYGPICLNSGEFLHAWSEAVGTDLKYLYARTSRWTSKNDRELKEAKESYHLNYTLNRCHLAYTDQHVAVYFFSPGIYETSFVKYVSDAWKYVKENYNPSTNQSIYTINLQYENITLNGTTCTPLNNRIEKRTKFVAFINYLTNDLNVNQNVVLDKAITSLVQLTLDLTQKTGTWPAQSISGWTMSPIVVYDIYFKLGLSFNANRWREIQLNTTVSGKFWFRDWYLKIYENNNQKSGTLKSFLFLLNSTWNRKEGGLTKQLNMGEFVHFWSGAAERNLLSDADNFFGWNGTLHNEFLQARKDLPNLNYLCSGCDNFRWKSYIDIENQPTETFLPIIVGVLVPFFVITLIVVTILLTVYRKRIKKLNKTIRSLTAEELDEFLSGNLEESTNDVNAGILGVPYNTDFELSKNRLVVDQHRVLGSGEFGFVFHGILRGDQNNVTADREVAVKTVKPNVEISYFKALLSEIKIMTHLGLHENIVSLLGTVTGNIVHREVFIALELCPKGNLLHYLQRNRHRFQASWTQSVFTEFQTILNNESNPDETEMVLNVLPSPDSENLLSLSTEELLEWSSQISNGMNYISSKNVIHGDLAARNILLTFNNVAKISDFGLSRQLVKCSVYQKTSKTPIPWKWLAIETLNDKTFSVHSDVWSFGITLWEIFSLGKIPYPGKCWDKNFVNNLVAGERLESPKYGNPDIYNLMLNCWKKEPTDRISFQEIFAVLSELAEGMETRISSSQGCSYTAL